MKRILTILPALLMLLPACDRSGTDIPDTPDIRFGLHISDGPDTKALLESDDLLATGTQVQVYGFATDDIVGHNPSDGTTGTSLLNEGQTIQYSTTGWSFANNGGESYQWKYMQTHKFFGWLTKDAKSNIAASSFFGTSFSFNESTKVLSIPAKEMGINASNFDFAYSDIVTRSATDADYSTVELSLNHLFASFGLSARNYCSIPLTIKSITLHGLRDSKSATIDYSGSTASVSYTGGSVFNPTLYSNSTGLTLAAADNSGDFKASMIGTPSDSPVYYLVWPQTNAEMTYAGTMTDGRPTPSTGDASQPYLEISYSQDGRDFTSYVAIPHDSDGWAAGVRYELELSFQDREIDLGFKAAPWDKLEPVIDYNGAVSVKEKLRLAPEFYNNCILSATQDTAYFKPGVPIVLEFAIGTPENATWIVSKKLDWDAFDVYNYPDGARTSPTDIVTAEGLVDGNLVRIAIDPPFTGLQKRELALALTFSVRLNNGDIVSIGDDDIYSEGCPRKFIYIRQ